MSGGSQSGKNRSISRKKFPCATTRALKSWCNPLFAKGFASGIAPIARNAHWKPSFAGRHRQLFTINFLTYDVEAAIWLSHILTGSGP